MKKWIWILLGVLLAAAMTLTAAAAERPLLSDGADLLEDWEEADLLALLERVSDEGGMDVVVVTVDSTEGASPRDFADDYYDQNGFGQGPDRDGLLLLVSMEERDWWISTCGEAIYVFTDAGLDYIGQQVVYYLSDGYYALAFEEFADQCERFILQAREDRPYDGDNLPEEPFAPGMTLCISLIVGLVIALIYTSILKGQMKSVKRQHAAGAYVRPGSMRVTHARDIFLYRTMHKTPRETAKSGGSSTHSASSGVSHGGRGGKF